MVVSGGRNNLLYECLFLLAPEDTLINAAWAYSVYVWPVLLVTSLRQKVPQACGCVPF